MPTLLLVRHDPTPNTRALADAVVEGAHDDAIEGVDVRVLSPDRTEADDITAADGVVIVLPANFGYMSGLVKDLFDRTFLSIGGALADDGSAGAASSGRLPYALVVHGRYDAEGAVRSVESIVQALPWRRAAEPLQVLGDVGDDHRAAAYEVGATLAALVSET
jgi:NAD(P)H-dependent FMN reductase